MKAAAIIPAYNEAATIAAVVSGLRGCVATIIVVDDGSTDETAARAAAAGAHVLRHSMRSGKGSAVRTGLVHLRDGDYTHVLLLDGDMQHLPGEAARLLAAADRSEADAVLGERSFTREAMPAARYHANVIGSWALSRFVGVPLRDTQCGFRVFRLAILADLPLRAVGYDIETEMLVKVRRRGGRIVGVPITAVYAGERSKLRPVRDTTRTCFRAVYYRFIEQL